MADDADRENTGTEAEDLPKQTDLTRDADEEMHLNQTLEVRDIGPCRKHLKVTVDRTQIDELFDEKYTELVRSDNTPTPGFRPGKAPRKLIERRYQKEVANQVKTQVLMVSLQQMSTENKINPLSSPNLDIEAIEIPAEGPLIYELEVEVAPEINLPNYKGLRLRRPVHTYTEAEIAREKQRLLEESTPLVPKEGPDPVVARDDVITANVKMKFGEELLNDLSEVQVKVDRRLTLSDGVAENFDKQLAGAKPGEHRKVKILLSRNAVNPVLRGKEIEADFEILDIKSYRPLEGEDLEDVLREEFGLPNEELFDEVVRSSLERRMEYIQRQAIRQQILELLTDGEQLELPNDLLRRQAERALHRRVMEMRSSGLSEDQILSRARLLRKDVVNSTASSLREHFVLQKIAELENIDISDDDIDAEIEVIADRSGESYRRVRARMEKDDLIDTLGTELMERRALDVVLESAEYEEYELNPEEDEAEAASLEAQVVPGAADAEDPFGPDEPTGEETSSEESKE